MAHRIGGGDGVELVVGDQSIAGRCEVTHSRCAVTGAILNDASLSRARPLLERSWIDLTAVAN